MSNYDNASPNPFYLLQLLLSLHELDLQVAPLLVGLLVLLLSLENLVPLPLLQDLLELGLVLRSQAPARNQSSEAARYHLETKNRASSTTRDVAAGLRPEGD